MCLKLRRVLLVAVIKLILLMLTRRTTEFAICENSADAINTRLMKTWKCYPRRVIMIPAAITTGHVIATYHNSDVVADTTHAPVTIPTRSKKRKHMKNAVRRKQLLRHAMHIRLANLAMIAAKRNALKIFLRTERKASGKNTRRWHTMRSGLGFLAVWTLFALFTNSPLLDP